MATDQRPSFFDVITAAATRAGGLEDAQAMRDELKRRLADMAPNISQTRGSRYCEPSLRVGRRDRATDDHVKTMAAMVYATLRAMGLEVDIAIVLNFTYRALVQGYFLHFG